MVACVSETTLPQPSNPQSIKLLDLLTNRYHVGVVRSASERGMQVDVAANSRLQVGQRVHFAMDGPEGIISRREMRRGFITRVAPSNSGVARIDLQAAPMPVSAVA